MGSDVYVYFNQGTEHTASSAELTELAADSGQADTGASADMVTARLDAATAIREGQDAELWVDVRGLHVFDPANGQNITLEAGIRSASSGG